jgi:hypothetical protein
MYIYKEKLHLRLSRDIVGIKDMHIEYILWAISGQYQDI